MSRLDEMLPLPSKRVRWPKKEIASEAGHWYLPGGTPYYSVKSNNGDERPATLRDARKVGAFPSVTGITGQIIGPALIGYFERQIFGAARGHPSLDFEQVRAISKEHSQKAAQRGAELHGAIEKWIRGESIDVRFEKHIDNLIEALVPLGIGLSAGAPEKSFAHPLGFGGKVDWHQLGGTGIVLDFKSKETIEPGKKYAFDEHAMQPAAYREGLGLPTARCINVFIGCDEAAGIVVHEWEEAELESAWEQFKHLLAVWQIRKKYKP